MSVEVEILLEVYKGLCSKIDSLNKGIIEIFDLSDANIELFSEELDKLEIAIVQLLGGNENHHAYIASTFSFDDFRGNIITTEELKEIIKHVIEEDFQGEIKVEFKGL